RYAFRSLRRQTAISLSVVAILAAGIGATTAAYTIVRTVLLQALPYPDASSLVALKSATPHGESRAFSAADWQDYGSRDASVLTLAAYSSWPMNLTGSGEPERLRSFIVSGEFFAVARNAPALGRVLEAPDDTPSAPAVVVLSHGLWTRRFGGA